MSRNTNNNQRKYESIEVLCDGKNYVQLPNETFVFMHYLEAAKITSSQQNTILMTLLTYKHDEKNPYPANETLAGLFDKTKRAISDNITNLAKAGLFLIEKGKYGLDKRKNTYNVSPLMNLLGRFVEVIRDGVDMTVEKFKDLYKQVIENGEKARVMDKLDTDDYFTDKITAALANLSDGHRKAFELAIRKYGHKLSEEAILEHIDRLPDMDNGKGSFTTYVDTCLKNASNGIKVIPDQSVPEGKKAPHTPDMKRRQGRTEVVPDWFDKDKEERKNRTAEAEEVDPEKQKAEQKAMTVINAMIEKEFPELKGAYILWKAVEIRNNLGLPDTKYIYSDLMAYMESKDLQFEQIIKPA